MSNQFFGFNFKSEKDRNDFFIALGVIAFFIWLFWRTLFGGSEVNLENVAEAATVDVVSELVDTDGDGIDDTKDLCPETIGTEANNGCPEVEEDSDGDGIVDATDKCPNKRGSRSNGGCPAGDTDADGIPDENDKCPDLAGIKANGGCPADKDKDGIYDKDDKCPALAGPAEAGGCPPDTDGDGVYDPVDNCPEHKGSSELYGCPPDSDNDGFHDGKDKCITVPGGEDSKDGCPIDTDKDGVPDKIDECPKVMGPAANKGCPKQVTKEVKEKLAAAVKNIQFKSSSDQLLSSSFNSLNEVVTYMNQDKELKLRIEGHTDSTGDAAKNLKLSQDRANACKKYLVSKNVDAKRILATGFGQTKPIGDNTTAEGRKQNRRVVFDLSY